MRGGYRKGAGRKQGFAAKNAEEVRKILADMVMSEIRPIGEALIARAKKGEVPAIRELFDRAFGKAPQTEKIDSSERPMPIPLLSSLSLLSKSEEGVPSIYGGRSVVGQQ